MDSRREGTQEQKEGVPLKMKFVFGSGMFGTQIFNGIMITSTAWFWLNIMGIDNLLYSFFMLVVYNIWNAVNDPVFGWLSDKTRTRWGRRIPYIRFFSPIWFIAHVLLFLPLVDTEIGLVIWFIVVLLIFDGCYTLVSNANNSLLGELSFDTTERASINTIAMILGALGNGISFLGPLMFKENVYAFQLFVLIGGIAGLITLLIPGFIIKEREIAEEETPLGLWTSIKTSFKNKPFLAYVFWYFAIEYTTATVFSTLIFYSTFVLEVGSLQSALLMLAFVIFAAPGFPLFFKMQQKKGIRKTVMLATLILAIGFLLLIFVENFFLVLLVLGIAGFGAAAPLMLRNVMIVEAADWDELETNRRREAMFFGANALMTKPAIGLVQAVLAMTLAITGFRNDEVDSVTGDVTHLVQTPEAILGIKLVMGLFPFIILICVGLLAISFYPKMEETKEMKRKLMILHEQKQRKKIA